MHTIKLNANFARTYKNNGQHAEQVARYTLTGKILPADNRPFHQEADCNGLQIKSSRATICNGTDIQAHIEKDAATAYGYVTKDFNTMYVMSKKEYYEFAKEFGTVTTANNKNKTAKTRLKTEGKKMKEWLQVRA